MSVREQKQVEARVEENSPIDLSGANVAPRDVHEYLRTLILNGVLPSGSQISQLELSKQLSVSRTPLREALRQLEREGLVINDGPHRLLSISPLTMADLDELYSMRVMGEALAIWLTLPALREADLDRLQAELELTESDSPQERREAHLRFHLGLRVGAGERLKDHLARLFEHAERYQRTFTREVASPGASKHDEHRAILDACRARDRNLARDLLVDHISSTAIGLMTAERYAPFALPTAITMAKAPRSD